MMFKRTFSLRAACLVLLTVASGEAQELPPDRRSMTAVRMGDGDQIVVDGHLDEPV